MSVCLCRYRNHRHSVSNSNHFLQHCTLSIVTSRPHLPFGGLPWFHIISLSIAVLFFPFFFSLFFFFLSFDSLNPCVAYTPSHSQVSVSSAALLEKLEGQSNQLERAVAGASAVTPDCLAQLGSTLKDVKDSLGSASAVRAWALSNGLLPSQVCFQSIVDFFFLSFFDTLLMGPLNHFDDIYYVVTTVHSNASLTRRSRKLSVLVVSLTFSQRF